GCVRDRAQGSAQDDRRYRLPERLPEARDRQHPDEYRGELEVRRRPGPEQLKRVPVPFLGRDEFRAAGFDRGNLAAVFALPNGSDNLEITFLRVRGRRHAGPLLRSVGQRLAEVPVPFPAWPAIGVQNRLSRSTR